MQASRKTEVETVGYRLGYRADIEGLRAVAVMLVVAAHAGVAWLEGGVVGVDVFFVLSGYLITGLLLQEIQQSGRVDLLEFYSRRLRRLLPGLLAMVVGTMAAATALLTPWEQLQQAFTAGAAVVWLSNLHFAITEVDYFGPEADSNLFLHTWSLGVEEQFYLVWPMLILALLWVVGARTATSIHQGRLYRGLMAVATVSFLLSLLLTFEKPAYAYYLPVTRAWQFALGALALLWSRRLNASGVRLKTPLDSWNPFATVAVGTAGLGLILFAALVIRNDTPYPGVWTLAPSVGTTLALMAGAVSVKIGSGRLLSFAPLQAVGLVSYSWYLWHWPVFLLGASILPIDLAGNAAALAVASLALAALSYRFIEKPARTARFLQSRPRVTAFASILLMSMAVAMAVVWDHVAGRWHEAPSQTRYDRTQTDLPTLYRMGCDVELYSDEVRQCNFGAKTAQRTAVLIGDSVAVQWFPAMVKAFDSAGWRLVVFTKSACPMVDLPFYFPRLQRRNFECERWRASALAKVAALNPDLVLLGSAFGNYHFDRSDWEAGTRSVLSTLSAKAGRILIIRSSPVLPFNGPNCLARADWRRSTLPWLTRDGCHAPIDSRSDEEMYAGLLAAAADHANAELVDFSDLVCPYGRCFAQRDGMIVYRDTIHLTASFVEGVSDGVAERIGFSDQGPNSL